MILEETEGCITKIENGAIVKKCGEETKVICFPGTTSKSGGFSILGCGGNGGYSHPDVKCFRMSQIQNKIKKAERI